MGALTDCLERALRDRQGFVKNSLDVIPQTNKEDNQEHYYKNKKRNKNIKIIYKCIKMNYSLTLGGTPWQLSLNHNHNHKL